MAAIDDNPDSQSASDDAIDEGSAGGSKKVVKN
jgi:hypothetical protein